MQTAGEKKPRLQQGELADMLAGRTPHSFLLVVVALAMALTLRGLKHDSPTEDEWAHLVRGISYFQTRDMRIHVQHPPLANVLDALPSAFDKNPDVTQMKTWQEGYAPGIEYIKVDYGHARAQLQRGRYVAAGFLALLVAYVFYFCLSIFGWPTAAAAACLIAFNPTLMGQARYVATDMPVAVMATIATGELVRYLSNSRRIFGLGLALSALVLSKHSGIVLLAILVLVAFLAAFFGKGIFRGEASRLRRLARWLGHFAIAGLIVLFSINAIYKFDRTGMTVQEILEAPEPQHWVTKSYHGEMLEQRSPLPHLPAKLRIPLPYSYLFGLFAVQEQNRGGYPSYFLGKPLHGGAVLYFPVLLILKDPPALLAMLGLGLAILWRRPRGSKRPADAPVVAVASAASDAPEGQVKPATPQTDAEAEGAEAKLAAGPAPKDATRVDADDRDADADADDEDADADDEDEDADSPNPEAKSVLAQPARTLTPSTPPAALVPGREVFFWGLSMASTCCLLVAALFLLFIVRSNLNMGVRHALAVIPLISVLGARAFARAPEVLQGDRLQGARLVGLSAVASAVIAGPGYLNYYNVFALGQGSWVNVVGDDWGQDREAFVRFAQKEGLDPLYYHTQTPTRKLEVDYLGLKYKDLNCKTRPRPGSWVAIHSQYVHRFEDTKNCATWMQGLEPTYKFNDNVWVYKIPAARPPVE